MSHRFMRLWRHRTERHCSHIRSGKIIEIPPLLMDGEFLDWSIGSQGKFSDISMCLCNS